MWQELKQINDSPLGLISLLYTNLKSMLLVKWAGNGDKISDRTGLTPFQVKLAKEKGNKYTVQELEQAIKLIRNTEKGIKTGNIETELAVDYILVNIL